MRMKLIVLLLSLIKFGQSNWSCGYAQEWGKSFAKVIYDDKPGTMGQQYESSFESDQKQMVVVTVTATVGGMLPSKPGDILLETSKVRKFDQTLKSVYHILGLCSTVCEEKQGNLA